MKLEIFIHQFQEEQTSPHWSRQHSVVLLLKEVNRGINLTKFIKAINVIKVANVVKNVNVVSAMKAVKVMVPLLKSVIASFLLCCPPHGDCHQLLDYLCRQFAPSSPPWKHANKDIIIISSLVRKKSNFFDNFKRRRVHHLGSLLVIRSSSDHIILPSSFWSSSRI